MAYSRIIYHIVFCTKHRVGAIPIENEAELYRYLWRFITDRGGVLYRLGGMPDHVHMLVQLPPTIAVADFVRDMKVSAHEFLLRQREHFPDFRSWSSGYCALSYCERDLETLINYIRNQKEHHKQETFHDELLRLLRENRIDTDLEHFLDD